MMTTAKARENRLRRDLDRQGYQLSKSRTRDPERLDHGLYAIVETDTNALVTPALAGGAHGLTLEEAEAWWAAIRRA